MMNDDHFERHMFSPPLIFRVCEDLGPQVSAAADGREYAHPFAALQL